MALSLKNNMLTASFKRLNIKIGAYRRYITPSRLLRIHLLKDNTASVLFLKESTNFYNQQHLV